MFSIVQTHFILKQVVTLVEVDIFCGFCKSLLDLKFAELPEYSTFSVNLVLATTKTYLIGKSLLFCRLPAYYRAKALVYIYRVSEEECARLRESVPYVKVYRYNPEHT